jgi:hypothetical protein
MAEEAPAEVGPGQPYAQPPPGWPYGDPPQPAAAKRAEEKPRRFSRKAWYLFGTGLIVLGFVLMLVFIGIAVTSGLRVFSDAVDIPVPGSSQVDLPPGEERMIWARPGDSRGCSTTDTTGADLPIDTDVSVSVDINGDEWVGVGKFPTGNGHVVVECDGANGMLRIAKGFGGWSFIGSILGAVLAPILLGFAGAAVLTVTGARHYRAHGPNGHFRPNSPIGGQERT